MPRRARSERRRLEEATLTGTSIVRGNLGGACLRYAGLGDIDWPWACLCGADLRNATFHMGSSRSGLVNSPIASEGSRTGFYTDEFTEQDFKAPEEIRKANLCLPTCEEHWSPASISTSSTSAAPATTPTRRSTSAAQAPSSGPLLIVRVCVGWDKLAKRAVID